MEKLANIKLFESLSDHSAHTAASTFNQRKSVHNKGGLGRKLGTLALLGSSMLPMSGCWHGSPKSEAESSVVAKIEQCRTYEELLQFSEVAGNPNVYRIMPDINRAFVNQFIQINRSILEQNRKTELDEGISAARQATLPSNPGQVSNRRRLK